VRPPQFPNQAQQDAQRVNPANQVARSQQQAMDLAARRRNSAKRAAGRRAGGDGLGLFFRILAFIVLLAIVALMVKAGIGILNSHSAQ
jgi:hypothetical protein